MGDETKPDADTETKPDADTETKADDKKSDTKPDAETDDDLKDIDELLDDVSKGEEDDDDDDEDDKDDDDSNTDEDEDDGDDDDELDFYPEKDLTDEDKEKLKIKDLDKYSDEEIAEHAYLADTFSEFIKVAKENEIELDDRFVAAIARQGLNPSFFAKHDIFSFSDFVERFEEVNEQVDPKNVIYPIGKTGEEMEEWHEKHRGVPRDTEGYDEGIFKDLEFFKDERTQEIFRERAYHAALTPEQARIFAEYTEEDREGIEEEKRSELNKYAKEQLEEIEEEYGPDTETKMKENSKLLWKHGREFAMQIKGTKTEKSKALFSFLSNLIDEGASTRLRVSDFEKVINMGSGKTRGEAFFKKAAERVMNHPDYAEENENSNDPRKRRAYKRLDRIHSKLVAEARRRGFSLD